MPLSGLPGWQSRGGVKGDPHRLLPHVLEAPLSTRGEKVIRIHLVGIFGLFCEDEEAGTIGASVQLQSDQRERFRLDLINGRHYRDPFLAPSNYEILGDGSSLETLGMCPLAGSHARVQLLTIDLPDRFSPTHFSFRQSGGAASFIIFDLFVETEQLPVCPFKGHGGGISLAELASVIRLADRVKLGKAMDQFEDSLQEAVDLDEARSQALTFLAVITAATIEMGATREMHRVQLEAARSLERCRNIEEIADTIRERVEWIADSTFTPPANPTAQLIDRALEIVDRHYAKELTDSGMAAQLGLSTSHFRYLFKQATGQPFHRYLINLRLEKAKQLLLEREIAVSDVADMVGFAGLSHFSRAFAQRFLVSPTHLRRSAR